MRWLPLVATVLLCAALAGCSDPESGDEGGGQGTGAGTTGGTAAGSGAGTASGSSGGGAGTSGANGSTGTGAGSSGAASSGASGSSGSGGGGEAGSGASGSSAAGSDSAGTGASGSGEGCGSRGLGPCADDELCSFPEQASCGEFDAPGSCESIPTGCTKELAPVCGCDGVTYSNRCMALAAASSVRHTGDCGGGGGGAGGGGEPSGDTCGGIAGLACPDGEYCDFAQGTGCGIADGAGKCALQPDACTLEFLPVCGCDGKTYGNACGAAAAGISVDRAGEC